MDMQDSVQYLGSEKKNLISPNRKLALMSSIEDLTISLVDYITSWLTIT